MSIGGDRPAVLAVALVCLLAAGGSLAEPTTRTLAFEEQCLDLDTNVVENSCPPSPSESGWDVAVGYNADRATRSVLGINARGGVEIAYLENKSFDEVTEADIDDAVFDAGTVDRSFDAQQVALIRTEAGAVFKLGNGVEDGDGLRFDYELLRAGS